MREHEAPRTFLSGLVEAICWGGLIVGCLILVGIRVGLFK